MSGFGHNWHIAEKSDVRCQVSYRGAKRTWRATAKPSFLT